MKILLLCGEIPFPPHGGSRMRVYQFIRALAKRHTFTLLAFQYTDDERAGIEALKSYCQVEAVEWQEPEAFARMRSDSPLTARLAHWRALLFDKDPFVAQYFNTEAMHERLVELLGRDSFDLIHVEDTAMMTLIPEPVDMPIVLSIQNVEYKREMRAGAVGMAQKIELVKLKDYERRAFGRAAVCCPTSLLEGEQIIKLVPRAQVQIVANGVDTQAFLPAGRTPPQPRLVFSGTLSYGPNADGIRWFAREVWPSILNLIPDACLQIVGREPPSDICALADERVQVAGDVPDVLPYLYNARVSIAPIFEGGGTRLKILEAMACALPVIATPIGAEGLGVTHGQNILIAENARSFARETVRLLRDPSLRKSIGDAGRAWVEQNYDWRFITQKLERIYLGTAGRLVEQS